MSQTRAMARRLVAAPRQKDPHALAVPVRCGAGWFDVVAAHAGGDSALLPFEVPHTCRLVAEGGVERTEWHLEAPDHGEYAVAASGGAFVAAPTPPGGAAFAGLVQPVFFRGSTEEPPRVAVERDGAVLRVTVGREGGARLVRFAAAWLERHPPYGQTPCRVRVLLPRRSPGAPPYTLRPVRPPDTTDEGEPLPHGDLTPSAERDVLVDLGRGPWLPVVHVSPVAPPRLLVWRDVCTNTVNFVADEGGCVRRDTRPWLLRALYPSLEVSLPAWRSGPYRAGGADVLLPAPDRTMWGDLHFVALYDREPPWLRGRLRLWLDKHPGCVAHVWGAAAWAPTIGARQWDGLVDGAVDRVRVHPFAECVERLDAALRELGQAGGALDRLRAQGAAFGCAAESGLMSLSDSLRLVALHAVGGCYADVNDSFPLDDLRHVRVPDGWIAVATETCERANNALIIAPRPRTPVVGEWLVAQVGKCGVHAPAWAGGRPDVLVLPPPVALDQAGPGPDGAPPVVRSLEHGFGPLTLWAHHGDRHRRGLEYGDVCAYRCGTTGCAAWWDPQSDQFRRTRPSFLRPAAAAPAAPDHDAVLRDAGVGAFRYPTGEAEEEEGPLAHAAAPRWRRWVPAPLGPRPWEDGPPGAKRQHR